MHNKAFNRFLLSHFLAFDESPELSDHIIVKCRARIRVLLLHLDREHVASDLFLCHGEPYARE